MGLKNVHVYRSVTYTTQVTTQIDQLYTNTKVKLHYYVHLTKILDAAIVPILLETLKKAIQASYQKIVG